MITIQVRFANGAFTMVKRIDYADSWEAAQLFYAPGSIHDVGSPAITIVDKEGKKTEKQHRVFAAVTNITLCT